MEYSLMLLWQNYWPLVLFIFFGVFLVRRGASKKLQRQVEQSTAAARREGMAYVPPGGLDTHQGEIQGTHRFSGTTRGIAWAAEVTVLTPEVGDGMNSRNAGSLHYTRWTAPEAGIGDGEMLLMTLPEGVKRPPAAASAGGFLGGLAAKAAWAASQFYLRASFGNERANALSLTPENHVALPDDNFGQTFVAFASHPDLLGRLSPAARDWLLKGRGGKAAFLWDRQGLSLTWPTAQIKPEEVAACAEYGAVLAGLLRGVVPAADGSV